MLLWKDTPPWTRRGLGATSSTQRRGEAPWIGVGTTGVIVIMFGTPFEGLGGADDGPC